jgi:hypothetical protein
VRALPAVGPDVSRPDGEKETVAIPAAMRRAVDDRDLLFCRMCGKYLGERRSIHHIFFGGDLQGMGGRRNHDLNNLVSLCWLPGDNDCHARAHSRKGYWQEFLTAAIQGQPNVTAFQLVRWSQRRKRNR